MKGIVFEEFENAYIKKIAICAQGFHFLYEKSASAPSHLRASRLLIASPCDEEACKQKETELPAQAEVLISNWRGGDHREIEWPTYSEESLLGPGSRLTEEEKRYILAEREKRFGKNS
jgi:hypothetical protein